MKTIKLPIFAVITLGAVIALAPLARADDPPATPPPAGGGTNAPGGRVNRRDAMEKLLTTINATDEQKGKLKPIFKDRDDQIKALREDTSLSRTDRTSKRKEIMETTTAKVKEVLTPDQFTKYEEFIKTQGRARRGQTPPPAGASQN